jgi:DNA invertase Pin-like site-specific DNA recombinase
MANIGYARVSTHEQNLDAQIDVLNKRCENVFTDKISSREEGRPGLQKCFDYLRSGDVLVVVKLDRLARSLKELIQMVEALSERGVQINSLDDKIDTTTPQGKFFFHVFGAVAEFERDLIRQRTLAGLAAARARGRSGGRPRKMSREKTETVNALLKSGIDPLIVAKQVGISKTTLYKYFPRGKPLL